MMGHGWHVAISYIGVGTVMEFFTGVVLDCVVLSNRCHGCVLGPKEGSEGYKDGKASHICQKKKYQCEVRQNGGRSSIDFV